MNRIAKFEKVSKQQFAEAMLNTFGNIFTANIDDVSLPVRATSGSAGYDFVSPISFELAAGESIKVPTGIRVNIREGWWLAIVPRSSLGFKYRMQLDNTVGVVDSDYYHSDNEGHIFVKITNDSRNGKSLMVNAGDKFAQAIFLPYGITYDDAASGIRNGGFGSTNTPHVIEFGQAEKVG